MRMFVKLDSLNALMSRTESRGLRDLLVRRLEASRASGKLKAAHVLPGARGGFMLFDAGSPDEMLALLGRTLLKRYDVEVHSGH